MGLLVQILVAVFVMWFWFWTFVNFGWMGILGLVAVALLFAAAADATWESARKGESCSRS